MAVVTHGEEPTYQHVRESLVVPVLLIASISIHCLASNHVCTRSILNPNTFATLLLITEEKTRSFVGLVLYNFLPLRSLTHTKECGSTYTPSLANILNMPALSCSVVSTQPNANDAYRLNGPEI